jgi:hypothetical protein
LIAVRLSILCLTRLKMPCTNTLILRRKQTASKMTL